MDQNLKSAMHAKVKRTLIQLEKNNISGYFVHNTEELKHLVSSLVPNGSSIAVGGSMTLFETGMIEWLRTQDYEFHDRYAPGLTAEELKAIHRKAFSCDAYFSSVNAVTESGELYSVDGNGNRVAAMIYGPDKVVIVAGTNKIVKSLASAIERNREYAAPANNIRLNTGTPCTVTGTCMDCNSPGRICCAYTTLGFQRTKNRIHVIFIDGTYGY